MSQIIAIYLAGLLQGLSMVAFPAASSVLTGEFHFSNTLYGALFIPQALLSIICSLLTTKVGGNKTHFFGGMLANFMSMALFAGSAWAMGTAAAFPVLLAATGFLGIGFGLSVPSLNTLASLYFPKQMDAALLFLNTLLGLGTALAPLLTAFFIGRHFWWGLPLLLALLILILLLFVGALPFLENHKSEGQLSIPKVFWLFALIALLYGIIETLNGTWATIYMRVNHADVKTASFALALFWAMVTAGRLFFTAIEKFFPVRFAFHLLPFVVAAAFLLLAFAPQVFYFGLAGFGCSALLPLIISFGEKALPSILPSVAGGLIAFYLLGYGMAAFGVGPLSEVIKFSSIFGIGAVIALILGLLTFTVKKESV
jgi:Major Facilitator Superfamily